MGALLLGIGLLVGLAWRISHDQQVVQVPAGPAPTVAHPASAAPLVGRVTGTADCRWATWTVDSRQWAVGSESEIPNPKSQIPSPNFLVPLGAKFNVTSGLMEITYDTGARVILQGPCMYEVESSRGGFLSLGKLTARVDKKAEGGGRRAEGKAGSSQWAVGSKSEISNPQSLIPNPLFSVRTPTAVVTDLGTQFGVEVEPSGVTRSRVFQGKIELRPIDGDGKSGTAIALTENESATVERGPGGRPR